MCIYTYTYMHTYLHIYINAHVYTYLEHDATEFDRVGHTGLNKQPKCGFPKMFSRWKDH